MASQDHPLREHQSKTDTSNHTADSIQAPCGTKRFIRLIAILQSTSAVLVLTLKISPRSPLKRLSESREEAAVLKPVLRACLLPLAAPGAQGSQKRLPIRFGEPRRRFWNTSPKQLPQNTLTNLQAPGSTKTIHSFCSDLSEHICCLNTQIGSRSPLKRLSESRDEAVVLEPVLTACSLSLAAPGAQGSLNGSQAVLGSQEAVLEPFSSTI